MRTENKMLLAASLLLVAIAIGVAFIGGMMAKSHQSRFNDKPGCGDYQLVISHPDSLQLWDGARLVGTMFFTDDTEIGNLIYEDNE